MIHGLLMKYQELRNIIEHTARKEQCRNLTLAWVSLLVTGIIYPPLGGQAEATHLFKG